MTIQDCKDLAQVLANLAEEKNLESLEFEVDSCYRLKIRRFPRIDAFSVQSALDGIDGAEHEAVNPENDLFYSVE